MAAGRVPGRGMAFWAELVDSSAPRPLAFVTKPSLRGKPLCRVPGTLFFNQALSDFVQVVGQHAQSDVALVAVQTLIGAAIQTMVLQTVDVRFNGVMLVAQSTKGAAGLTLLFA